jgi:adenosylcobinamide kinase/adenosylcobinamide-phosphate guanylyltransferase
MKRKSGDRPDEYGLASTSLGELKSISTCVVSDAVAAAYFSIPALCLTHPCVRRKERHMRQGLTHSVILVLGGVRSGKSRYAQQVAERSGRVTFIATAERRDDEEMRLKIERHRAERPNHWVTVEEPLELAQAINSGARVSDLILVDCLTLFAANLLEAHGEDETKLQSRIDDLCSALRSTSCPVVLVSNEVGSGVVPEYASGRRFRDLVGEINQRVATVADDVLFMVAGLPLALKGSLAAEGGS